MIGSDSLIEFGAGLGCYSNFLRQNHTSSVQSYDGAPNVEKLSNGTVKVADLTQPLHFAMADWVLCLETAEHIPHK